MFKLTKLRTYEHDCLQTYVQQVSKKAQIFSKGAFIITGKNPVNVSYTINYDDNA